MSKLIATKDAVAVYEDDHGELTAEVRYGAQAKHWDSDPLPCGYGLFLVGYGGERVIVVTVTGGQDGSWTVHGQLVCVDSTNIPFWHRMGKGNPDMMASCIAEVIDSALKHGPHGEQMHPPPLGDIKMDIVG